MDNDCRYVDFLSSGIWDGSSSGLQRQSQSFLAISIPRRGRGRSRDGFSLAVAARRLDDAITYAGEFVAPREKRTMSRAISGV